MVNAMARRMFDLLEPIGVIPYSADEPNETMFALGFTNYWDTYFAGRAAPLGRVAPEVVDALYYNFAPGEVARGTEAHVLFALELEMPAEKFGRIHHLPAAQLNAVIDGMRDRGLIGDDGWLSERGRAVRERVEALTDDMAAKPYECLEPDELDELTCALEPLAALLIAAQN